MDERNFQYMFYGFAAAWTILVVYVLLGAGVAAFASSRAALAGSLGAGAMLGLVVPGIVVEDPACVSKTFPNFFTKLASPPPGGLGVTLRDAATGRALPLNGLDA